MKLKYLFLIILVSNSLFVVSQTDSYAEYETRLNALFRRVIDTQSDEQRIAINDTITTILYSLAETDPQWNISFDSIRYIGRVVASDQTIALYSWVVPLNGLTIYNALLQLNSGGMKLLKTTSSTETIDKLQIYTADNWYGALYYGLIPFKSNKNTYYAILGWRNRQEAHQKVIDILSFEGGEVTLGKPLFEHIHIDDYTGEKRSELKTRAVFEFDSRVSMYLEYNAQKRRIEFDNLSPMEVVDGIILSYGPDFSMNAYRLRHNKWLFVEDIKVKSKK